jgi:hypothetical protein
MKLMKSQRKKNNLLVVKVMLKKNLKLKKNLEMLIKKSDSLFSVEVAADAADAADAVLDANLPANRANLAKSHANAESLADASLQRRADAADADAANKYFLKPIK